MHTLSRIPWRTATLFAVLILAIQMTVLFFMGQPLICECGYIKLWEGVVLSPGNSQHLTDWYTFSHVIHGIIFYWILWLLFPNMPVGMRLVLAIGIEAGWEMFENTPMVIEHYREQALAQGYVGDSIINSLMDTLAALFGFIWAWRMPVWASIAAIVGMEAFVGYSIRDNLLLNITGFFYQFEFIQDWQSGG